GRPGGRPPPPPRPPEDGGCGEPLAGDQEVRHGPQRLLPAHRGRHGDLRSPGRRRAPDLRARTGAPHGPALLPLLETDARVSNETRFWTAVTTGDPATVELLVRAQPELATARRDGVSAVLLAMYHHKPEVAACLRAQVGSLDSFRAGGGGGGGRG